MIQIIGFGLAFFMLFFAIRQLRKAGKRRTIEPTKEPFPLAWREILSEVEFYARLSASEKSRFEFTVQDFLANCTVTGVEIDVDDTDRVYIAASAIIPIFNFPDWTYSNISEVLLYPNSFDHRYNTEGGRRPILGMVGEGVLQGKMILSKQALRHGFDNSSDKHNTAIHEFVHLIDKSDGYTDGVPELLLEHKYVMPWLELIRENIEEIHEGKSDINPYAATNNQEFLAVVAEYFFSRPELLEDKHPELYGYMQMMFGGRRV